MMKLAPEALDIMSNDKMKVKILRLLKFVPKGEMKHIYNRILNIVEEYQE